MAEQLTRMNTDVAGARNLGIKLVNNSLMKNPEPDFLQTKTTVQTKVQYTIFLKQAK
jgi:hypothetical protein